MTSKITKLITYLQILRETLKFQQEQGVKSRYHDVDIDIPDEFVIIERWQGEEDFFFSTEFPMGDIDTRIRSGRDHLRYLKKQYNGKKNSKVSLGK